jgi:hypothetical protein
VKSIPESSQPRGGVILTQLGAGSPEPGKALHDGTGNQPVDLSRYGGKFVHVSGRERNDVFTLQLIKSNATLQLKTIAVKDTSPRFSF